MNYFCGYYYYFYWSFLFKFFFIFNDLMHVCIELWSYLPHHPPQAPLISLSTSQVNIRSLPLITHQVQLMLPLCVWMDVGPSTGHGKPTSDHTWKKKKTKKKPVFPPATVSCQQLLSKRWGLEIYPFSAGVWLVWPWTGNHSCYELVRAIAVSGLEDSIS